MTRCSDCGRDVLDSELPIGSACADRGGHEARCNCQRMYRSGLIFGGQPGFAGLSRGHDCPFHGRNEAPR